MNRAVEDLFDFLEKILWLLRRPFAIRRMMKEGLSREDAAFRYKYPIYQKRDRDT